MSFEISARRSIDNDQPPDTYEIEVPEGCNPGDLLVTVINGIKVRVTLPAEAQAGDVLSFEYKPGGPSEQAEPEMQRLSAVDADGGMMEVIVPEGAVAGDFLTVETSSGVLNVPVPEGAEPGTVLMFDPRVA